jgi:hypothetical protein
MRFSRSKDHRFLSTKMTDATLPSAMNEDTFLTSIAGQKGGDAGVGGGFSASSSAPPKKRPVYEPEGLTRVKNLHGKVSHLVDNLAGKLGLVLRKQEKDFLSAYRAHMYNVQKELQELRAKVDESELELRKNQKIVALQKERDWYRGEALRLDTFATNIKKDLKFMRERLTTIDEDRNWLERQLKASKKQNKLLRAELEIRLSATPATTSGPPTANAKNNASSSSSSSSTGFLPPARSQTATPRGGHGGHGGGSQGGLGGSIKRSKSTVPPRGGVRGGGGGGSGAASSREINLLRSDVERLQQKLRAAERNLTRARAGNVERDRQRSAMEDLFLRCVDTVKSQIQRRMPRGGLTYSPSGKAALRATDGGHTTRPLGSDDHRQQPSIELDQFTKVDRRTVIEELLNHDEVLAYLYDALFPVGGMGAMLESERGDTAGGMGSSSGEEGSVYRDHTPQEQQRSASRWRNRVAAEEEDGGGGGKRGGKSIHMPAPARSGSRMSSAGGDRIRLDPAIAGYLQNVAQATR